MRERGGMAALHEDLSACCLEGRESQAIVSDLDGVLLRNSSHFAYYMLAAWEAPCGFARFILLLLLWPHISFLQRFVSQCSAIKVMAFIAFAGVREADIVSVARAVLPKFYAEDVRAETWRVMSCFGRRYVVTANPRLMVEPFATEYLGAAAVLGAELEIHSRTGRATGFLLREGRFMKGVLLRERLGDDLPDVALGDGFLSLCKEGYAVSSSSSSSLSGKQSCRHGGRPAKLCRPVVFHDGRLAGRPTPMFALSLLLWLALGVVLAALRGMAAGLLPCSLSIHVLRALGVRLSVRGGNRQILCSDGSSGIIFASAHRTLMDPVFISIALGRPIAAVTFSLSRLSEMTSPIPTVRLTRNREADANIMKKHLQHGDLVVCPEGTTCREPFLLRFSALFAELSDCIVPVAIKCHLSMFHATTARGFKGLDSFYFYLNPTPSYEITFCEQLPEWLTHAGGRPSHEVANFVQSLLASTLGFKCTTFTRKDKYRALVGSDDVM